MTICWLVLQFCFTNRTNNYDRQTYAGHIIDHCACPCFILSNLRCRTNVIWALLCHRGEVKRSDCVMWWSKEQTGNVFHSLTFGCLQHLIQLCFRIRSESEIEGRRKVLLSLIYYILSSQSPVAARSFCGKPLRGRG